MERSKRSVNNVAERAEVDEDDDTEDNCSFGVESVLIACRLIVAYRFWRGHCTRAEQECCIMTD